MIRFEQVTRRYEADGRPALDDVTVEFYRGDFAFLIGASGSGKSTLLRMILREGLPQRGKVTVAGQNLGLMLDRRVPDFRRSIGMVFQDFRLLPDKTVFDNVAFAMRVLGAKRSAIRKRVTKVLEKVDLAHLAKRYPHEISGGEQQRAAIARAIVNDPAILLADEPTGNLDPRASAEVMKVLRWINVSGTTVIMATHDRAIVDQADSRVVELHRGRLVRDEPHGFYDAPEGSQAWEVLAQAEDEAGLRAHDPAPLETGLLPVADVLHDDTDHGSTTDVGPEGHHTWEPDTQDHHFVESRDESIDHVGDHPQDQVMAPGEDPSVLAYNEDPVLQETAPLDSTEELAAMELEGDAIFDAPFEEEPENEGSFVHVDSNDREDEHSIEPDPEVYHDDVAEDQHESDADHEQPGLRITWPDHLREDAHHRDVPELHGGFDGTEMPDLEQQGHTETEVESTGAQQAGLLRGHADDAGVQPAESHRPQLQQSSFDSLTDDQLAPLTSPPARHRLSWLAHSNDAAPQRTSAEQTEQPAPSVPGFTLDPSTPQPVSPSPPLREMTSEPAHEPEPQPGLDPAGDPQLESEPESAEPRPVPKPMSSASQSTSTDTRREAEPLGVPRARRSIMRRLRRDK
ncbi:cell division ATP-binding protein FtsE [Nesterenkonia sp. CF4.4]|uniref:cell division ATP-binding protein FtsE n=1 Tax=Nesterenkonia sp. CF4.4 TaxID=3373079 RepID=UPI003EE6B80A